MRLFIFAFALMACTAAQPPIAPSTTTGTSTTANTATDSIVPAALDTNGKLVKVSKTDSEWKACLSEMEFYVLRTEGTERAFSGDLVNNHDKGTFICRGCHLPLFASSTKFESGTGWPSFWQSINKMYVTENSDNNYGMTRTEVECARCGGHLGHVFDDGPKPTGLRYCINSVSLDFVKE